ncbi:hypothetical protein GCM10027160_23940 [Streptomyces calidiresistens]|uniref:Uncharacterized protein n=1 Tax=Streptomyces calidiresistens TaxID=1485586 RepID=A0A7W3XZN1_9ACTN|nr:hypothetical protein [Streptomyces calidiresistens]MBB0233122.1 hypothetical protein [Streptomyces calidiresistens]
MTLHLALGLAATWLALALLAAAAWIRLRRPARDHPDLGPTSAEELLLRRLHDAGMSPTGARNLLDLYHHTRLTRDQTTDRKDTDDR